MKALIAWLITIEDLASLFYAEAAASFRQDQEFAKLLRHLADDEAWHSRIMVRAFEYVNTVSLPPSGILLDEATRAKIESPLRSNKKELDMGTCTKEALLNCIVTAEYSEWNDIFLYVINTLKEHSREFADAAAKIQQHKKHLERYLATVPEGSAHLDTIRRLPPVWREKILIVDDDAVLVKLFSDVLVTEGAVITAANGKEGFQKTTEQHLDAILSDVDMPVMDGLEFYRQAIRFDPSLRDRFLFLTGNPSEEHLSFFRQNDLRYFVKPVSIVELEAMIHSIVSRTRPVLDERIRT